MTKILLTGASGKLGHKLIDALDAVGYELRILSRRRVSDGVEHFQGDLLFDTSLEGVAEGCDIVLHLAAVTHTNNQRYYKLINVEGTALLLKQAKQAGVKQFIYMSTRCAVEGAGAYGESKLAAEQLVEASGLNYTLLRPSEIYGTDKGEAITDVINKVKASKRVVYPRGDYELAPLHVDDLIAATLSTIGNEQAYGERFTLAGPKSYTMRELIAEIERITWGQPTPTAVPQWVIKLAAFLLAWMAKPPVVKDQLPRLLCEKSSDISPAKEVLGFEPRGLEEALSP